MSVRRLCQVTKKQQIVKRILKTRGPKGFPLTIVLTSYLHECIQCSKPLCQYLKYTPNCVTMCKPCQLIRMANSYKTVLRQFSICVKYCTKFTLTISHWQVLQTYYCIPQQIRGGQRSHYQRKQGPYLFRLASQLGSGTETRLDRKVNSCYSTQDRQETRRGGALSH